MKHMQAVIERKADNMLRHSKRLASLHKFRGRLSRDFSHSTSSLTWKFMFSTGLHMRSELTGVRENFQDFY